MQKLLCSHKLNDRYKGYAVAVIFSAITVVVRLSLDEWLAEQCPFSLFYLSVLLAAWIGGTGPAILAILLGTVSASYFFIKPQGSFAIDTLPEYLQLSMFIFVNCAAVLLFQLVNRQRTLADQRSVENEQLSQSLRDADRRKDEFLALLAHELRNPLAPICSALVVLDREPHSSDSVRRAQRIIERQTNHLVRITNDLLDTSRFCRGKLELQINRVDLRNAIADAVEMTVEQFEERSHHFQQLIPEHPVWINGDGVRLVQLTANLLSNAAKYTPSGGRIVLELDVISPTVSIVVRDNGIGFPPEEANRIVQPFMQVDTSRTREYGGLGLGLTIVKRLAELHGGSLTAQSRGPGKGSCFTVSMPTASPPDGFEPAPTAAASAIAEDGPSNPVCQNVGFHRKRILIVEDNQDAGGLLQDLLESDGFDVVLARDGVGALQLTAGVLPHVCILDIGLPGMDGYEVARRIRRMVNGKNTRLIAMTGWGNQSDRKLSSEAGFDLHLVKPIVYSELLQHIETGLHPVAQRDMVPIH